MISKLPIGWKEVKLGDVLKFRNDRIPLDKIGLDNYISTENLLPKFGGKRRANSLPKTKTVNYYKSDDILVSNIRPYFKKIWKAVGDGGASSDILVFKNIDSKSNSSFLYYRIANKAFFDYVMSGAKGTKMPRGDKDHILKFKFGLPTDSEQKAIANTLSTLDDKIENNNKINRNLEEQAQVLFKHWFVDFEFPNEEGNPYNSSGGEMVVSELGMIPKGWSIQNLNNLVNIKYGKNLPTSQLVDNGFPVFGGNGIIGYYDEYMYKEPQVLVACRGAASGKINISNKNSFVTNNSLILETKNRIIYQYVKERFLYNDFKQYATGSAQPQITINNISDLLVVVPSNKQLESFYKIMNPISEKILKNVDENMKIAELRDVLLPKLMSGELRIPLD